MKEKDQPLRLHCQNWSCSMMKVKAVLISFIVLGLSFTLFQVFIKDNPTMISQKEAEAIVTKLYGGKILNTTADKENNNYQISIENDKGIYNLFVNRETKKINDVRLIERKETLLTVEEAKNNIENELNGQVNQIKQVNKKEQPFVEATVEKDNKHYSIEYDLKKKMIVSNKEMKVASNTQNVDRSSNRREHESSINTSLISEQKAKDIALQQINGQITNVSKATTQKGEHYKVTVDGQSDGAHVYVQANTGKVSSISWYSKEQPSKDDNDDDDDDNDDDNSYDIDD